MDLLIQEKLKKCVSLDKIAEEHGLKVNRKNGKIGIAYDQVEARQDDPLASQCRGVILREGSYDKVAVPFFRFFNLSQGSLTPKDFDWDSAKYELKLDGSLLIVYFDEVIGKWFAATRNSVESESSNYFSGYSASELADIAVKEMWKERYGEDKDVGLNDLMDYFGSEARGKTFCFELTSPLNRIVCKYNDNKLTLLGVRDNETLEEQDPYNWVFGDSILHTPETFDFPDFDTMCSNVDKWNPLLREGIVIKDKNFNRIKLKTSGYLYLNSARDSLPNSIRNCAELVLLGKDDDVVAILPDIVRKRIELLREAAVKIFSCLAEEYNEVKHIDNMKEFAEYAKRSSCPEALFALKRGNVNSVKEFFVSEKRRKSRVDKFVNLCEKFGFNLK